MTENVTNDLIYEILKRIRDQGSETNSRVIDLEEQMNGIRYLLASMQSDGLRHDATIAGLRADVNLIKKRLDLADA